MPTKMKDDKKGGEDRVKKSHEDQQKEMKKSKVKEPEDYSKPKDSDVKDIETDSGKSGI